MSAETDYLALPLRTFLADLAAKSPTPGGGSVAAMVGAVAAAQARMVIAYTSGNPRFAEHEPVLRDAGAELKRAEAALGQLMSEDMAAYERFAVSRKSDDADERQRAAATAAVVPMETVVLTGAILSRLDEVKAIVNPYLFSDLQVAAILAFASARSAAINVRINLKELADRAEADKLAERLDHLISRAHEHRAAVVHYQPA